MTKLTQEIKVDDVFHVRYTASYRQERKNSDLSHCFEGLAIATKGDRGIVLIDTYWGLRGGTYSKIFTLEDIGKKIEIEFYCNLDDITRIHQLEIKYYSDEDIIFLHDQHACMDSCKYYYTKKGAIRNKEKILQMIEEDILEAEKEIRYASSRIADRKKLISEIEVGKPLNEVIF